jgi:hypothetical protein
LFSKRAQSERKKSFIAEWGSDAGSGPAPLPQA